MRKPYKLLLGTLLRARRSVQPFAESQLSMALSIGPLYFSCNPLLY